MDIRAVENSHFIHLFIYVRRISCILMRASERFLRYTRRLYSSINILKNLGILIALLILLCNYTLVFCLP